MNKKRSKIFYTAVIGTLLFGCILLSSVTAEAKWRISEAAQNEAPVEAYVGKWRIELPSEEQDPFNELQIPGVSQEQFFREVDPLPSNPTE